MILCFAHGRQPEDLLADLFVNYDCEMNATNIFDRIVKGLCYVIISKPTYDSATVSKMKVLACKGLFQALVALRSWYSSHQTDGASGSSEKGEDDCLDSEGQGPDRAASLRWPSAGRSSSAAAARTRRRTA